MEVGGEPHATVALLLMTVNWVGPRASLDILERETPLPLPGLETWFVQPIT